MSPGDRAPASPATERAPLRTGGELIANLLHFARALRGAGLPIGPGRVLQAVEAVRLVGLERRQDLYWALHAALVNRREQRELFDQAFHVFWRNPRLLQRLLALTLPTPVRPRDAQARELLRRLAEALAGAQGGVAEGGELRLERDAAGTRSEAERLRHKDFEQMSTEELAMARRLVARLGLLTRPLPSRRLQPHPHGQRVDLRGTVRASLRAGGEAVVLQRRRPRQRHPPLVLLCDISGSMSRYARMLLHFAHSLSAARARVSTFVFATRLTNISRYLRARDVDLALGEIGGAVEDWSGGTRIGACLHQFNREWSRRTLAQGAVVLLVSDGLDCEGGARLGAEMERLHKSCRRLVWLNPLLRYTGFEPKAQGMRAILPHVDELRAAHNIASLAELGAVLVNPGRRREEGVSRWVLRSRARGTL